MGHHLVLYQKPGCHLCEIAHELLLGLHREFDFELEQVDIRDNAELFGQYWDKVPVVVVDNRTLICAPIKTTDVRAALQAS